VRIPFLNKRTARKGWIVYGLLRLTCVLLPAYSPVCDCAWINLKYLNNRARGPAGGCPARDARTRRIVFPARDPPERDQQPSLALWLLRIAVEPGISCVYGDPHMCENAWQGDCLWFGVPQRNMSTPRIFMRVYDESGAPKVLFKPFRWCFPSMSLSSCLMEESCSCLSTISLSLLVTLCTNVLPPTLHELSGTSRWLTYAGKEATSD